MARQISFTTTDTTIKVRVTGLDTGYDWSDRTIKWLLYDANEDLVSSKERAVSANASNTSYVTFDGLEPDSKYIVKYELIYSSTESGLLDKFVIDSETIWTDEPEVVIALFKWDTAKTSGNSFKVTASEWNRLIDKITEVYTYLGWSDYQDTYPITKVSSGEIFYAKRFNEVKAAIGNLYSTGISDKSKGDSINASDLNQLVTSLNAKINSL